MQGVALEALQWKAAICYNYIKLEFLFVGADAHIGPNIPGITGRCGHRPLQYKMVNNHLQAYRKAKVLWSE